MNRRNETHARVLQRACWSVRPGRRQRITRAIQDLLEQKADQGAAARARFQGRPTS